MVVFLNFDERRFGRLKLPLSVQNTRSQKQRSLYSNSESPPALNKLAETFLGFVCLAILLT